jgi:4-amino-4-deoxy-L-arabinose transferase-like glycosyltransferase
MKIKMKKNLLIVLLVLILVLSVFLRFWQLDILPPGVWYDEAYNGLDALQAMNTGNYKLFYPENYGREGLYVNAIALSFKIFGIDSFALRFPSAFFGALTVLGFYFLLRSLKLTRTTILLGVFVMTTSFYHLNFSRIAFRAIMVPFLLTWSFYFFIKGLNLIQAYPNTSERAKSKKNLTKANFSFFLAGALTGLGLHTYIAYRVVPLIFVILLIVFLAIYKKFFSRYWKGISLFIIGALITAGPLLFYFQQNPAAFTGRTDAVSIFNSPNMTVLEAFGKSLSFHLQSFFFIGDGNQRHNHNSLPILPAVWALFFAIGFSISLKEIFSNFFRKFFSTTKFSPTKLFLPAIVGQSIFWTMLIPGVLSMEGIPHSLRIIGVIPAIFLLTVLPFEYLRRLYLHLKTSQFYAMKRWRWLIMQISFFFLVATFILTGFFQMYTYFELWAENQKTAESFQQDLSRLGRFIKEQPLKKHNYLLLGNHIEINKGDRSDFSEKSLLFSGYPSIKYYLAYNINENISELVNGDDINCSDSQFILQQNIPLLALKKIANYCPNLELQKVFLDSENSPEFWMLK